MNGQRPPACWARPLPLLVLGLWAFVSCAGDQATVYVPGSSFAEELQVMTGRGLQPRVQVGESLVLHAQRRSGPWVARSASEVGEGACSLASLPPQLEAEVADNVTWRVEPEGPAAFNTDLRDDGTRTVRFDAPGTYLLSAESGSWCGEPFGSDTVRVEVVE